MAIPVFFETFALIFTCFFFLTFGFGYFLFTNFFHKLVFFFTFFGCVYLLPRKLSKNLSFWFTTPRKDTRFFPEKPWGTTPHTPKRKEDLGLQRGGRGVYCTPKRYGVRGCLSGKSVLVFLSFQGNSFQGKPFHGTGITFLGLKESHFTVQGLSGTPKRLSPIPRKDTGYGEKSRRLSPESFTGYPPYFFGILLLYPEKVFSCTTRIFTVRDTVSVSFPEGIQSPYLYRSSPLGESFRIPKRK